MSAPVAYVPVPAVTAPRQPLSLFVAAYLLSGASALWLTAAIATLFAIPQYSRYYGDREQNADAGVLAALLLIVAVVVAVLAVGLSILLALLDAHGRPAGRVLTWIFSVVAVVIAGSILMLDLFAPIPWHRWQMAGTAVLTLGVMAATGVLLMLPSSSAYFRAARDFRTARQAAIRLARQQAGYYRRPGYPPAPYPPAGPAPFAQPGPPPFPQPGRAPFAQPSYPQPTTPQPAHRQAEAEDGPESGRE
ncbi:hypothetical protein GCM10027280_59370 [Micromonospora polyrhachis]|uniref:Uncharacterized protein n=1 Tax=Micromonospora polyrhachis TaxID=1282883 RepID=A0A7W7SVC8_9ACTN|nr:hypothetical protein [Micromonospora polyrhachis]MBB4961256.1 hypothetical protein [Micromonospora polyrhachis]